MPDFKLAPASALAPGMPPVAAGLAPCATLEERRDVALCSVLARPGQPLAERVEAAFGIALPSTPRFAARGGIAFIWAGPRQWLALAGGIESRAFEQRLRSALAGAASVIDQSDGRAVLRISGPRARDALAKGLPVDLHPRAFQPGDTALTVVSHVNVHVWQVDASPCYELAVFRSFAAAFAQWFAGAAAEYGPVELRA